MGFIFAHLEYFVAGIGIIGSALFLTKGKNPKRRNDLTPLIIKHNHQQEALSKKSKGVL